MGALGGGGTRGVQFGVWRPRAAPQGNQWQSEGGTSQHTDSCHGKLKGGGQTTELCFVCRAWLGRLLQAGSSALRRSHVTTKNHKQTLQQQHRTVTGRWLGARITNNLSGCGWLGPSSHMHASGVRRARMCADRLASWPGGQQEKRDRGRGGGRGARQHVGLGKSI